MTHEITYSAGYLLSAHDAYRVHQLAENQNKVVTFLHAVTPLSCNNAPYAQAKCFAWYAFVTIKLSFWGSSVG